MFKKMTSGGAETLTAWILLLPAVLLFLILAVFPLISVFVYSATDKEFAGLQKVNYVGLDNYKKLLSVKVFSIPPELDGNGAVVVDESGKTVYQKSIRVLPREPISYWELKSIHMFGKKYVIGATEPEFLRSIYDTVVFALLSVFFELLLGLLIALLLNYKFRGQGFMRMSMLIPWAIPTAVSARIWTWMFASQGNGLFNSIGVRLGLSDGQTAWLVTESLQLPIMIVIDVWKTTPFMALLILAGLQTISKDFYEAADIEGASPLRQFFKITLPLLKPFIAVALVFRILDALRVFDLFQIIFGSQRFSMSSFTYYQLVGNKAMGYSSAASVLIFIFILIFAMGIIRFIARGEVSDE